MGNSNSQKKKIQVFSVISIFVFLADIYLIVNMKDNYIMLGIAALATLFSVHSLVNGWTRWKEEDSQRGEEHYIDIMKAEKSTHLVSQKRLQDLDEKMNFIGQKIMPLEKAGTSSQKKMVSMLESFMDGQKKMAKVTVERSKENATALINSNDRLLKQMEEVQQSMVDMKSEILEKQNEIYDKKIQKMDVSQRELVEKIQKSSDLLKNIIEIIPEKIEQIPQAVMKEIPVPRETPHMEMQSQSVISPATMEEVVSEVPEQVIESEAMPQNEPELEVEPMEEAEPIEEAAPIEEMQLQEEPELEATPVEEMIEQVEPELETAPVEEMLLQEEPELEAAPVDEAISQILSQPEPMEEGIPQMLAESSPIPIPAADANGIMSPEEIAALLANTVEPEPEPEPIPIPAPVIVDANRMMSPEEIAALLGNTVAEQLPDVLDKIEEEPTTSLPDLSDPGRMMGPEDIASLIANM